MQWRRQRLQAAGPSGNGSGNDAAPQEEEEEEEEEQGPPPTEEEMEEARRALMDFLEGMGAAGEIGRPEDLDLPGERSSMYCETHQCVRHARVCVCVWGGGGATVMDYQGCSPPSSRRGPAVVGRSAAAGGHGGLAAGRQGDPDRLAPRLQLRGFG